jgi:hypothetical protein
MNIDEKLDFNILLDGNMPIIRLLDKNVLGNVNCKIINNFPEIYSFQIKN